MRNALIYSITKKNSTEVLYIGSTTNFTRRQYTHRTSCISKAEKNKKYNLELYEYIRNNDGFGNFMFNVVLEFVCSSLTEQRQKEQEYIDKYGIDYLLNDRDAYITPEEKTRRSRISSKKAQDRNRDEYNKRRRDNYSKNSKEINEKKNEKILCSCGKFISKNHKARHLRTH
jgi:hypothetical protein